MVVIERMEVSKFLDAMLLKNLKNAPCLFSQVDSNTERERERMAVIMGIYG